jgi:DNA-directed RNA polymerase specialized sigma24 family protein
MPEEQVNRIEPYFNFWCVRTITNSAGRWGQVGKYAADPITDTAPDIADTEDEQPDITPLRNLYWYDRELLSLYAELGSTRAVSDRLGIPLTSIKRDIADAKQRARELLARTS